MRWLVFLLQSHLEHDGSSSASSCVGFVPLDKLLETLLLALAARFATLVCLGLPVLVVALVVVVDLKSLSLLLGFLAIWFFEVLVSSIFDIDVDSIPLSSCFDGNPLVAYRNFLRCVHPFHK